MKAKLKTLKRGQTFYGAGIQWLVLGHTNSSQGLPIVTHIVSTGIVERRAFDEKNRNDLGVSTLLTYLNGEFLERLEDAFGEGAVAEQFIDLTSNDGLKDYGNVKTKVGLLTEEEYRQHRDILPPLPLSRPPRVLGRDARQRQRVQRQQRRPPGFASEIRHLGISGRERRKHH